MHIEMLQTTSHHRETRDNISSPSSSITQAKQEIALEPSPLKSEPIVSEKKNSSEEIDLTGETSDKTKSKVNLNGTKKTMTFPFALVWLSLESANTLTVLLTMNLYS
ncbi:hypothetical protein BofuT4_P144470.1 [Botrytis cinerea T4]|uniref:Uncharacterized protein n=1 Tax=Botryotinia fuckeliana (strain T4) TaxID=999810 RepID=G2YYE1_BOTF4|nr:hypothetical protein BofuT4_P144470.1 [Botrytis cinerea T4]